MHTAPSQNAMRALVGFLQEHHNIREIGAQFVRTHREASLWLQLVTEKYGFFARDCQNDAAQNLIDMEILGFNDAAQNLIDMTAIKCCFVECCFVECCSCRVLFLEDQRFFKLLKGFRRFV